MKARLAKQRGVAVVTALLLTTLAITIVASLFWQQQVQVRSMENQRLHLQTRWILRGALDWARLILRQSGYDDREVTRENGVWATPLAETRLDQYVERERLENESYDATIAGQIYDAQSRYNLGSLARQGQVVPEQLEVFQRLLVQLQLDAGLAVTVANEVARSQQPQQGTGGQQPAVATTMELLRVEDLLAVAGFTQQAVEALRPFVIVLPDDAAVNVNTASPEVLAALVQGMSVSQAQALVQTRRRTPFLTRQLFDTQLSQLGLSTTAARVVESNFFLVQSWVKLDRAALETWALIRRANRNGQYLTSLEWIREN
ncbi:type II secretion system minor pseudopilin GspK [Massilia endophytica]|uniref:type II secretion system minor pseudopilin GspK n=1 Tax=Massilia endophytica TaxID=2899220 RepID=UPI001E42C7D9|nr:type II secretion system minor pseudopilin GspK [Massilia endophytica]UGQ46131.1 type II secretion system minor pseudopilin GspK [Massilia endophytica]